MSKTREVSKSIKSISFIQISSDGQKIILMKNDSTQRPVQKAKQKNSQTDRTDAFAF